MKRLIAAAAATAMAATGAAAAPVCTLLADAASGEILTREGMQCGAPTPPASTFKIPLALMGFHSGVLTDAHAPLWPYRPEYNASREAWRKATDPTSWLADSVLWYSRELTRALGMEKFRGYVEAFKYGNRDVSGTPGRDDGLTASWLGSSLKISPDGQIDFLRRVWNRRLPVAPAAYDKLLASMPHFPLADGWIVYGKTGTGYERRADGRLNTDRQFGWFVGWAIKGERTVLFARLIKDDERVETPAGPRARDGLLADLPALLAKH